MGQEVMLINEYKLDLSVPNNQAMLNTEMARFLKLPSAPEDGGEAAGPPPPVLVRPRVTSTVRRGVAPVACHRARMTPCKQRFHFRF